MPHSYQSQYPDDTTVEPAIVKFLEDFYAISDRPDALEEYLDLFDKDAKFILASKISKGHDEIRPMRLGMWEHVKSREHTVHKVFPFGSDSREFMLYGSVKFCFKNGQHGEVDWAARAVVSDKNGKGKWRMSFYQVYLDTGAPKK